MVLNWFELFVLYFTDEAADNNCINSNKVLKETVEYDTEAKIVLSHLNRQDGPIKHVNIENEKLKWKLKLMELIDSITTAEELEVLQKCMAPLSPTLAAVRISAHENVGILNKKPHNKNIESQRRLYSTKKSKKVEKSIVKPSTEESQRIAISLIQSLDK